MHCGAHSSKLALKVSRFGAFCSTLPKPAGLLKSWKSEYLHAGNMAGAAGLERAESAVTAGRFGALSATYTSTDGTASPCEYDIFREYSKSECRNNPERDNEQDHQGLSFQTYVDRKSLRLHQGWDCARRDRRGRLPL